MALLAARGIGQTPHPHLFDCIGPLAYAAMQKKVWLRKKNAYLMLARGGSP
jgi:hypothetical protein